MVEALRRDNEYERTTPDGSYGRDDDAPNDIINIADRAKQQVGQGLEKAGVELDRGQQELAGAIDATAQRLEAMPGEPTSMPTRARLKMANGLEHTAVYLKSHNRGEMRSDIEVYVKKHPVRALVGIVIVGIVIGRILR